MDFIRDNMAKDSKELLVKTYKIDKQKTKTTAANPVKNPREVIDELRKTNPDAYDRLEELAVQLDTTDDPNIKVIADQNKNRKRKVATVIDQLINDIGGAGDSNSSGLYNDEIVHIMQELDSYHHGFRGVFPIDRISKIPATPKDNTLSFIANLSPLGEEGTHWVSCYINVDKGVLEYYDSYGRDPPQLFLEQIKPLIDKLEPEIYLKFKINRIVQQRANSSNCAFFAIKFLLDRYANIPFKDCTSDSAEVLQSENSIKRFKSKLAKFGYI